MRRMLRLLGISATLLVLAACGQAGLFSLDGSYVMTIIVSETNTPGLTVGEVEGFVATFTTTGNDVQADIDEIVTLTGTRTGNSVMLEGSDGASDWTLDLTWTSTTEFEGEGRIDDGVEYADFVVDGYSSPLLAGE